MTINSSNETALYTDQQFVEGIKAHRPKAEKGLYFKCKEAFAQETANYSGMRDSDRDNIVHEAFLQVWQKILDGEVEGNNSLTYFFLKVAMEKMSEEIGVKREESEMSRAEKAVLVQRRTRMEEWDNSVESGKLKVSTKREQSSLLELSSGRNLCKVESAESSQTWTEGQSGADKGKGWWHGNYFKIGVAVALVVVALIVLMSVVTLVPAKQKKIEAARAAAQEEEVLPISQILGSKEIRATFPIGEVGQILLSERYDYMLELIAKEGEELRAQRENILSEDNGASSDEKEDMLMVVENQLYDLQWFEIVSLVGTNQLGEAREKLEVMVEKEGQYQEVAKSLQEQIK